MSQDPIESRQLIIRLAGLPLGAVLALGLVLVGSGAARYRARR